MWIELRSKLIAPLVASLALISVSSCRDAPVPKPRGYHRIAIPEPAYQPYSHPCGPAFDVPHYAKIELVVQGQSTRGLLVQRLHPTVQGKGSLQLHSIAVGKPLAGNDGGRTQDGFCA